MNIFNVGFLGSTVVEDFVPTDVAGLTLWINSENVTKDGGNLVSQMTDLSGNDNHLVNGTVATQPLWVDGLVNSLPAVTFPDTDQIITVANFAEGNLSMPYYFFMVLTYTDRTGSSYYDFGAGVGASLDTLEYYDGSTNIRWYAGGDEIAVLRSGGYHYNSILWNGASSSYREDGVETSTANIGSQVMQGLTLGASKNSSDNGNPLFCEFLIYNNDIGTSNRDKIETYLKDKYNL